MAGRAAEASLFPSECESCPGPAGGPTGQPAPLRGRLWSGPVQPASRELSQQRTPDGAPGGAEGWGWGCPIHNRGLLPPPPRAAWPVGQPALQPRSCLVSWLEARASSPQALGGHLGRTSLAQGTLADTAPPSLLPWPQAPRLSSPAGSRKEPAQLPTAVTALRPRHPQRPPEGECVFSRGVHLAAEDRWAWGPAPCGTALRGGGARRAGEGRGKDRVGQRGADPAGGPAGGPDPVLPHSLPEHLLLGGGSMCWAKVKKPPGLCPLGCKQPERRGLGGQGLRGACGHGRTQALNLRIGKALRI